MDANLEIYIYIYIDFDHSSMGVLQCVSEKHAWVLILYAIKLNLMLKRGEVHPMYNTKNMHEWA